MVMCLRHRKKEIKNNDHPLIVINFTQTETITISSFHCVHSVSRNFDLVSHNYDLVSELFLCSGKWTSAFISKTSHTLNTFEILNLCALM